MFSPVFNCSADPLPISSPAALCQQTWEKWFIIPSFSTTGWCWNLIRPRSNLSRADFCNAWNSLEPPHLIKMKFNTEWTRLEVAHCSLALLCYALVCHWNKPLARHVKMLNNWNIFTSGVILLGESLSGGTIIYHLVKFLLLITEQIFPW